MKHAIGYPTRYPIGHAIVELGGYPANNASLRISTAAYPMALGAPIHP